MIAAVKHQTCGIRGENMTPQGFGRIHALVRPTLRSAHRVVCSAAAASAAAHPLAGGALIVGQAAELPDAAVWNERRR